MSQPSNQYFSFSRFSRLFRRHTAEHWSAYAMAAAVSTGLLLLVMGFATYLQNSALNSMGQSVFFTLFLLAGTSIFASSVFAQFGEGRRATVALLLPASHLEKYLVAWIYSLPIFLLAFIPLFYLADAVVVYSGAAPWQTPELFNLFTDWRDKVGVFWVLAVLHGVGLFGAIYFEKIQFIKTSFAMFILLGVVWVLNFQFLKLLIGARLGLVPPFTSLVLMEEGNTVYTLSIPESQHNWLIWLPVGLAVLLWLASYFRLTEKQI
ncbi:hypothetical protein [Hymenobacter terrenus]|uniref:hypothetical protein n=1 Tax=Hymenobacter terrenus TaxID=1629124 RepID=UPI000619BDD6|nr:hypothetical protein [Hymenobacter terrenus]